ncbi:HNH endonuclease [Beijerinckia mobilis]|uniref:HNH endonuclease n=1 Tax=Beijerinckia mobilis TaxID=231434 RepID=UPI002477DEBB|nr:HNH endonuclease [Beijerinckia mobilis]
MKAPWICPCGLKIAGGEPCPCSLTRRAEQKARADRRRLPARERGYDSKWERERELFLKDNRKCKFCCEPATIVDHIVPHKGDMKLFWSRSNWQPLCVKCHSSTKQRMERSGLI